MNASVTATAPGKVVLSGEYAVLDGAAAVCMAVGRRAVVTIADSSDDCSHVSAPGHSATEGRFTTGIDGLHWTRGASEYAIVDAVFDVVKPVAGRHLLLTLDSRQFVDRVSGRKTGIGSSAAMTVALVAALGGSDGLPDRALRAHRALQAGAGSGVDVATAICGGLIEYRMREFRARRLDWPAGLEFRVIWTGASASTRAKLDKLAHAAVHASRDHLCAAAEAMATAWSTASAGAVLAAYPAYVDALRRFSVDHDLGIFDAGHEQLVDEAAAAGLVYKPAGAGGGDIGILLGRNGGELDEFAAGMELPGAAVLPCVLDPDGVILEEH